MYMILTSDKPHEYTYSTLSVWSDGFNDEVITENGRLIGEGGFAKVYLGELYTLNSS